MQEENLKSIQPNKNTKSSHSINRLFNNKIKPILNENISNNDNNIDNTKKIPLIIPDFNTKNIVLEKKYKLDELKKICDVYKLKKSGKKEILKTRIYDFLNHTFYILKIQRCFRKFIVRQLNYYKGPALLKRGICNNDTDFFGFDDLIDVKYEQFFSYKANDKFIYGFDISSLYNLIIKNGDKALNPYNRQVFPNNLLVIIRNVFRISNILKLPLTITLEKPEILSKEKKYEMRIVSLCQKMDELGNYTDMKWFHSLSREKIIKFILELYDIWSYRAQISNETKRKIVPPNGDPFMSMNINNIRTLSNDILKNLYLNIINNLVNKSPNSEDNTLGAYYVLSSLTLVSIDAANALPWLYESVAPI